MATVYSLICFGGRTGKAVTAATTDLFTLTNHGLRDGTGVAFTSGTLPSVAGAALALNTVYFAKSISASTFELYYDAALTSKIDITSTGSALIIKSAYFLGLTDLSRWGSTGSERIYDGLNAWFTARNAACTEYDPEVCELGMAFTDIGTTLTLNMAAPQTTITSRVNGVRSDAFHGGVVGNGFAFQAVNPVINLYANAVVDGFSFKSSAGGPGFVKLYSPGAGVANCIIKHTGAGNGIETNAQSAFCVNNLVIGVAIGITLIGSNQTVCANNTVVKCTTGFYTSATTSRFGYWYNNISVGNTTNYTATPTSLERASRNFGEVGDTNPPWVKGAGTYGTMATTDFVDWANDDYRPASITSPQVDGGVAYYNIATTDLADDEVPNYNNGGAELVDAGAYEFDHGYGPHPASHTLTLTNVVVGSRILIRDQANTTTHYSADAASSTVVVTLTVYADARDEWDIKVRKGSEAPFYQPYRTQMTATAGASSIYVSQIEDQ